MYLNVVCDDGRVSHHHIVKENFYDVTLCETVSYIGTQSKESNALNIFKAYFCEAKIILLDETNKAIVNQMQHLNIHEFNTVKQGKTLFDKEDFSFMYYTSGSSGNPIGALKSIQNIKLEVNALTKLLQSYAINKVIVTVPFIHLYGTLFGLMYPLFNNIDIVFKEHFLPHDLLDFVEPHTMVVTTPLYIKAFNKMNEKKDLSRALFISSTAPLDDENIRLFQDKYHADIIQIYGSTETGGIAYKLNVQQLWQPFDGVNITTNDEQELTVQSPFVSSRLYENDFINTQGKIQTFDYIEQEQSGFKLIGRSAKIFKLAGKRYSTIQIENILEDVDGIGKALVFVVLKKDALRGEHLDITLESHKRFTVTEIKKILQDNLSNLKFSITLNIVKEIPISQMGKKLRIK